jgi:Arc/MetJ-type ribon-helix-helix transcriptional regulator
MLYTALYMATSTRTQVYLTAEQRRQIDELRARDGRTLAEVVRAALDEYLTTHGRDAAERERTETQRILDETFGSMPELQVPSRDEWDRFDLDWNRLERD